MMSMKALAFTLLLVAFVGASSARAAGPPVVITSHSATFNSGGTVNDVFSFG